MHHRVDGQVFNGDDLVTVDDAPAVLVREILASVGDTLVDIGHRVLALLPRRGAFLLPGQAALYGGQRLFVLPK